VAPDTFTRLEDLRRIDGRLRMRCDLCGSEAEYDREALIKAAGWQMDTALATLKRSCSRSACSGMASYSGVVPWCEDAAELKRRVFDNELINLACHVLKNAAYRRAKEPEQQLPVRLALRVVHAFGADTRFCTSFWNKVTKLTPTPWDSCHNELNRIVLALVRRGWSINAELQ
jgi:hypothetical protein